MKLLALDTATDACSVALNINSELIEHYELMPRRHSHNLLPMIEKLLSEAGVTLNNIDALAFGRGPGTFTGLRVAASITQGLAFAVDIPVIPISTLAALAQQAHRCYASTHVISAIDARMGELYWGAFTEKNNLMVSQQNEVVIAPKKAILVHSEHTQWTGIGTGWLYHQQLSVSVNQFYEKALPHAQDIAALAEYDFNHGYLLPAEEAIPVYLRDKVALKKMSDSEQLMPHLLFVDPSNWPIESEVLEEWVSDLDAELLANKSQSLPNDALLLSYTADRLTLQCSGTKESPIFIDFIGGQAGFRRKFGGGKGQNIAKAIGMNKKAKPSVLDATGGLGHDAFVFASLGCEVTLIERSPIIAILLEDGLKRALLDREVADIIKHMHLIQGNAIDIMPSLSTNKQLFDVVYLDPMFPHRRKSASVKKEMRLLQKLLGEDTDADELLIPALSLARHRVVIKRPKGASDLGKKEPSYRLKGKSCRYDIHALKSFD